jgi:hypothetical protein
MSLLSVIFRCKAAGPTRTIFRHLEQISLCPFLPCCSTDSLLLSFPPIPQARFLALSPSLTSALSRALSVALFVALLCLGGIIRRWRRAGVPTCKPRHAVARTAHEQELGHYKTAARQLTVASCAADTLPDRQDTQHRELCYNTFVTTYESLLLHMDAHRSAPSRRGRLHTRACWVVKYHVESYFVARHCISSSPLSLAKSDGPLSVSPLSDLRCRF